MKVTVKKKKVYSVKLMTKDVRNIWLKSKPPPPFEETWTKD